MLRAVPAENLALLVENCTTTLVAMLFVTRNHESQHSQVKKSGKGKLILVGEYFYIIFFIMYISIKGTVNFLYAFPGFIV